MVQPGNILADLTAHPGVIGFAVWLTTRASDLTEKDRDRCISIVKAKYPEWGGKADDVNDLPELWRLTGIKLDSETNTFDTEQNLAIISGFADDAGKAMIDLTLWVFAIEMRRIAKRYFDGLTVNESLSKMISVFVSSMDGRKKGGEKSTKFTVEVRAKAEPIFAELKRASLSNDAASIRTSARLELEYGINISPKTINRHLSNGELDNA